MIDRRDISYTQGSPQTPVINGVLLKPKPSVNVPKGTVVSSVPPTPTSKTTKIDPFENAITRAGGVGGLSFGQVVDFWTLIFGSAEQQQATSLGMVAGSTDYIEKLGLIDPGSTQKILDIPAVDFAGSDIPGLPALDIAVPGAGDFIGKVADTGDDGGLLSGVGKWLMIGAAVIGGLWLVGKYVGRPRK